MRNYFVKFKKTSLEPEEILLDPIAAKSKEPFSRLELAVPRLYSRIVFFVASLMLLTFLSLSFYYQFVRGSTYSRLSEDNRLRLLITQAPRGIIYDRYGKPLVTNEMIFDVVAVPLSLPKEDALLLQVARETAPLLDFKEEALLRQLQDIRNTEKAEPVLLAENISRQATLVFEAKSNSLPGIQVSGRFQRRYFFGAALSHVLGYTGRVSAQEMKDDPSISAKDVVGREGIEAYYDRLLRGKKGKEAYEINAALEVTEEKGRVVYEPGSNLRLSIDAEFQAFLYETLRPFTSGRPGGAAAVALDPRTGEVLSLLSLPSYDNNLFARGISQAEFQNLLTDPAKPLFNRAVAGEYSSGSTIKPFLAAAALEEKVIDPKTKIPVVEPRLVVANPYDPERPTIYRDWQTHGWVDMAQAIAVSSNVYFYILGGGYQGSIGEYPVNQKGLGVERIKKYLSRFGWGTSLGIDLPGEKSGLLPDPTWKEKARPKDPTWRVGDTYILSIGQGDLLTTPLQLTAATAIFANGGKLYAPQLVRQVLDPTAEPADGINDGEVAPRLIRSFDFSKEELRVIREGMRLTVAAGSARRLADLPFPVAGKTGTVQVSSSLERTNAIFVSFMPYDEPELILTILVEGGGEGGATAVPIAREALTWYWYNRILNRASSLN
jgi:penicillin-binding protein 2